QAQTDGTGIFCPDRTKTDWEGPAIPAGARPPAPASGVSGGVSPGIYRPRSFPGAAVAAAGRSALPDLLRRGPAGGLLRPGGVHGPGGEPAGPAGRVLYPGLRHSGG